jgi:Holliday junction DNA helicase RuvA
MISYVSGKLVEKTPAYVVVETGGVGFQMWIPLSSYEALGDIGSNVRVLTHLHVREDVLQLFGFSSQEERDLFQVLITVSGIGPRSAQGILSGISVDDFKRAVRDQDIGTLTSAPGVGRKTAERLVLELREKIGEEKLEDRMLLTKGAATTADEAVLALVSLGYKRSKAQEKVQMILRESPSLSVEEVIREVLRRL